MGSRPWPVRAQRCRVGLTVRCRDQDGGGVFQTSLQTQHHECPQLPQFYHKRRGPAGSVLSLEGAILEGSP